MCPLQGSNDDTSSGSAEHQFLFGEPKHFFDFVPPSTQVGSSIVATSWNEGSSASIHAILLDFQKPRFWTPRKVQCSGSLFRYCILTPLYNKFHWSSSLWLLLVFVFQSKCHCSKKGWYVFEVSPNIGYCSFWVIMYCWMPELRSTSYDSGCGPLVPHRWSLAWLWPTTSNFGHCLGGVPGGTVKVPKLQPSATRILLAKAGFVALRNSRNHRT